MSGKKIVGLDTNLFIYQFGHNLEHESHVSFIFNSIAEKKIYGITSIIAVTEVLSIKASSKVIKSIQEAFFSLPNIAIEDVDEKIALRAATIRRKYSFRTADALLLATALQGKADYFVTNDKKLQKFKEVPVVLLSGIKSYTIAKQYSK